MTMAECQRTMEKSKWIVGGFYRRIINEEEKIKHKILVRRGHRSRVRDASPRRQHRCCCRVIAADSYYTERLAVLELCVGLLQKRCAVCGVKLCCLCPCLHLSVSASVVFRLQDKLLRNLRNNSIFSGRKVPNYIFQEEQYLTLVVRSKIRTYRVCV